eukprot:5184055-Ditylum_brightwellii.AAC.1
MNLAIQGKHTPERWKTIYKLYLLKEAEIYRRHRLRTLYIIDAELNLMRQELIVRRLMKNAELFEHLSGNQYGGRKGHAAIDILVLMVFLFDILYMMRANTAFTYCDARVCYDRIVVIIAALTEQAAELAPEHSIFLAHTLIQLEYHILTAYGLPEQKNFHSKDHPVHGMGQGPCDTPSKWTCMVNPSLKSFNKKAKGCLITDPTRSISIKENAKMYVDDNKMVHNNKRFDSTAKELMNYVDHDVNLWDELLYITGGLLEQLKTNYSLMVWNFEETGKPYVESSAQLPSNKVK